MAIIGEVEVFIFRHRGVLQHSLFSVNNYNIYVKYSQVKNTQKCTFFAKSDDFFVKFGIFLSKAVELGEK